VRDRLSIWIVAGVMLLVFGRSGNSPVFAGEPLTDPTRPPATTAGQAVLTGHTPSKWQLTSTIVGPERRVAIIDGQVVQIGETIDGAVLEKVAPGSAFLVHEGRSVHLKLNEKPVKYSVRSAQ